MKSNQRKRDYQSYIIISDRRCTYCGSRAGCFFTLANAFGSRSLAVDHYECHECLIKVPLFKHHGHDKLQVYLESIGINPFKN